MPTYEYRCTTCGHRFDYFQSISSDALTNCPRNECALEDEEKKGTGVVVRLVSGGAGLVFKGEGFYLTDYVRKSGEKDRKSSGGSSSGSGGSSSGGGSGSSSSSGSSGGSSSGSSGGDSGSSGSSAGSSSSKDGDKG
jgi:putative FmdB family regulatory protein